MVEKNVHINYTEEIEKLVRDSRNSAELCQQLDNYHEKDIADSLESFSEEDREKVFKALDNKHLAEILPFAKDVLPYVEEIGIKRFSGVISNMDADDAVDILENMDEALIRQIAQYLHVNSIKDIRLIRSYHSEQIGSQMTTNFIRIREGMTVKQATKSMIEQAKKHDNLNTIYVVDEEQVFVGAIELQDLITAREYDSLADIMTTSYPYVYASESMTECVDEIRDYAEDSIPVLGDDKKLLGVITSTDIIEMVDSEMGEDYARLAGMTAASDLHETVLQGMRKRMPWLVLLLFLGMGVSSVVGLFETVVSQMALIVCFQSLILDMAGNVGTQSLAVTIRLLVDENVTAKEKLIFISRELRIGAFNGALLGGMSFVCIGLYIMAVKGKALSYAFAVSGCVGAALFVAMIISSLVGVLIPMLFHRLKVDPAVASGPLITTINDLVAVVTYYGLSWMMLINIRGIVR